MVSDAQAKEKAIQDAVFDAAVADLTDNTRGKERVIDAAKYDEGEFTTFVLDSKNADKVTVYSTVDGTPSQVLMSMLAKQLRKRVPRDEAIPEEFWGKRAFTHEKPNMPDTGPKYVCWFHKDSPQRPELDEIGLGGVTCTKKNIPTLIDVEYHVMRKHPQRFKLIEQHRSRRREDEDRSLRREEVAATQQMATGLAKAMTAMVESPRSAAGRAAREVVAAAEPKEE